jgi:branched-chain amino acid transport system substrate-binding protein
MKKKGMFLWGGVFVILSLLMVGFNWAQAAEPGKSLTIGVSVALSGPAAPWGMMQERGVAMALEDINGKGGVTVGGTKYKLDYKVYDHAYSPPKALEIVQRLMKVDNAIAIVTHGATATMGILPYTEEKKTFVFFFATGSEIMTLKQKNYYFRTLFETDPQAPMLLWDWVSKNRSSIKNVAVICPDDASGWGEAKDMRVILPKYGLKGVNESFYQRGITDFYPLLTKVLMSKPDAIDLGGSNPPADSGRIMKQAREMGFKGAFIASSMATIGPTLEIAKEAAEGLVFGREPDFSSQSATSEEKAFYNRFVKTYPGSIFDSTVSSVARSLYVFVQAIEKVNTLDPDKIAQLLHTSEFTVFGKKVWFGGASVFGPPPNQLVVPFGVHVVEKGGKMTLLDLVEMPKTF